MAINFHIAQSFRLMRYQDAEKNRQRRSRILQTLNGDPAASPLGGAHRLGAPYSSHRAPQRVRLGPSLAAALYGTRRVLARQGWADEKAACMSILREYRLSFQTCHNCFP